MKLADLKDRRIKSLSYDGASWVIVFHAETKSPPKFKDDLPECKIICKPKGAPEGTQLYLECESERIEKKIMREPVEN